MHRRSFLELATHGLGALFALIMGIPAVLFLLDPRNRPAKQGDFRPAGRLSDLQVGVPKQFVIRDTRTDAWTYFPNDIVGRVWLIYRGKNDKGEPQVDAYSTICPHLGCSINYNATAKLFVCPCHNGTFNFDCKKLDKLPNGMENPPPRDMDSLTVEMQRDPGSPSDKPDYLLSVKYQNFYQGRHEKVAKA